MDISATFFTSAPNLEKCPKDNKREYAFIGRSNVGKSSLINMLCNQKKLAKTSSTPGKTRLFNYFLINQAWYLVDLPGYGWARVSKSDRNKWQASLQEYLLNRKPLLCTFVLIDVRLEPQKKDLEFMEWLGGKQLPFVIVYTKADKLTQNKVNQNIARYKRVMAKKWELFPTYFITSSVTGEGQSEILKFIEDINNSVRLPE